MRVLDAEKVPTPHFTEGGAFAGNGHFLVQNPFTGYHSSGLEQCAYINQEKVVNWTYYVKSLKLPLATKRRVSWLGTRKGLSQDSYSNSIPMSTAKMAILEVDLDSSQHLDALYAIKFCPENKVFDFLTGPPTNLSFSI